MAISKVQTIFCSRKYYQNDFRLIALMKSPKIFTICQNCPAEYLKAKKKKGCKDSFLAICKGDKSYSKDPYFLCR